MGLMHITGARDGPPVKVGVAVTDLTTGLYTSNAIMAALLGRIKSGKGQHLDVALSDCQVATLANIASSALISGQKDSGRWGTSHRKPPKRMFGVLANFRQLLSSLIKLSRRPTEISYSGAATTACTVSYVQRLGSQNGSQTTGSRQMRCVSRIVMC